MSKAKKTTVKRAKSGKSPVASKKARPPADNPFLREEQLEIQRTIGRIGLKSEKSRPSKKGKRAGGERKGRGTTAESDMKKAARARLDALEQFQAMSEDSTGASPEDVDDESVKGATHITERALPVSSISNWVQIGPTAIPNGQTYGGARVLVTGRVTALALDPTDPKTIYLGAAQGGVWKTKDGGVNWVAKTDHEVSLSIGALAIDPKAPSILYAATGEGNWSGSSQSDSYYGNGVLKSFDGGNSWSVLNPGGIFTGNRFRRIAINPISTSILYAATEYGLFQGTNSGTSWHKLTNDLPAGGVASDVVINPLTPKIVYAAFKGIGIYKTSNGESFTPSWKLLKGGLPASGFDRVALGISPSSPNVVYALMSNPDKASYNTIDRFYRTEDDGASWDQIPLPGGSIDRYGWWNLWVEVDWTTPNIVYLCATSVWKAVLNEKKGSWTISNIGLQIHPDNHALAISPFNNMEIYAGNDGGIYKSVDGGQNWSDKINEGPCITQLEFMAQHPTSDAVAFSGTQDNGTEQFRNSPVFHHADDGDGGYTAVDQSQPERVLSTFYGNSPKRSVKAGRFDTWDSVDGGLAGSGLFYPPMVLDRTNSMNVAFGTDRINLDHAQGTGWWPVKVLLPGITGFVSAIDYVNSNLIYVGTTEGEVYRLKKALSWSVEPIHSPPLPKRWIKDIAVIPKSPNNGKVIVVMSGFGKPHVWLGDSGFIPGPDTDWYDISANLPDIPVNALVLDRPMISLIAYIGTDIGVFRREMDLVMNLSNWEKYSQGLPNCAVFDMRLHQATKLLRAATHGRGMWERKVDAGYMPNEDIFVRDNLMDTGRFSPSPSPVKAAFEDLRQQVNLGDTLFHWMCADIKVDSLSGTPPVYQMDVADVDYVAFESKLSHIPAQPGKVNRVYVQVHNRGIKASSSVVVKLLFADLSLGLPDLPADFWIKFPNNSADVTKWKPIGAPKTIASLSNTEPTVLEWDWVPPPGVSPGGCLLVIVDCPSNPIPPANKLFAVSKLVWIEKRVGMRNILIIEQAPEGPHFLVLNLYASTRKPQTIKVFPSDTGVGGLTFILPKIAFSDAKSKTGRAKKARASASKLESRLQGVAVKKLPATLHEKIEEARGNQIEGFDMTSQYVIEDITKGGKIAGIKVPRGGLQVIALATGPAKVNETATLSISQEEGEEIVGGITIILRATKE